MEKGRRARNCLYMVLFLGTFLAGLSISNFVPSLLHMAEHLETLPNYAQLTLPAFLFSFACAQLFYGTASDRFGRRIPYIVGACFYMLGSLICFYAGSILPFIVGRFVQGAGIGCATVLAIAILHDIHDHKLTKTFAYLMITAIVGFVAAPIVTLYVTDVVTWQFTYLILAMLGGLLAILAILYLPETNLYFHETHIKRTFFLKNYIKLIADRVFMGYLLTSCLLFCTPLIVFITMPILLATAFQLSVVSFTWLCIINVGFYLFGIYFGNLLTNGLRKNSIISLGMFIMILSSAIGLLLGALEMVNLEVIYLPTCFILLGSGLSLPCSLSAYTDKIKEYPGTAVSIQLFCLALIASGVNIFNAILHEDDQIPLMGVFLIVSLLALAVFWLVVPKSQRQTN